MFSSNSAAKTDSHSGAILGQKNVQFSREAKINELLGSLTLHEKIGQTVQERSFSFDNDQTRRAWFAEWPVGSLFCGGEIINRAGGGAVRDEILAAQSACKMPLLVAGDLEHGAGGVIKGLTLFPHMMALGAANDEALAYEYGKWTALEGRAAGFTWTFAPVVDLLQNWLNPVVSNRALGANPEHVARLADAIIRGLQDHGLAACAKHFPGDGVDFRDQHLVTSVNSLSREEWEKNHGRVFQSAINAGVYSIMSGHIALPWLEPMESSQRRPRPSTVSRRVLMDLLRNQMGFEGVIVSDALEMAGFTGWASYEERIIQAFNAGNDVMLWPGKGYFEIMERAINKGLVPIERLDDSVKRILNLKIQLGLTPIHSPRDGTSNLPLSEGFSVEFNTESHKAAAQIAEKSITLVRNRQGLLPLASQRVKRVLLHQAVTPEGGHRHSLQPFIDRLKARGIELTILVNGNCLDLPGLEEKGARWDAYLVIFNMQIHEMKNTVRPVGSMGEVMWTLQNGETVQPIVISCGTPFLLNDMPFLDTLINTYSSSESTLIALDQTLFAEIPFNSFSPVDVGGNWIGL